jgi:predicted small secreted protein
LKHSIILVTLLTSLASTSVFAKCNTVMGGCEKVEAVNVSPHMHSDYNANVVVKDKSQSNANKGNKNVAAETKTKENSKKL